MSRLRHSKGVKAGALSGVHRLEVDKPRPFKPEEERKHGGHIGGKGEHSKLGRKRGGSCHAKGGHVGHGHHGTDATPDRGMKYGTPVQDMPMAGTGSGYGGKFALGKGHVEDSLKDGGKVKWIQRAINPKHKGMEQAAAKKTGQSTHAYMEKHKHDAGAAGSRARLGLRLSAMAKHKKTD
jgi:hypothetical protein